MSLNLQDPLLRLTGIHPRQTGGPLFCQILTDFARGGRRANSTPGPARVKELNKQHPDTKWRLVLVTNVRFKTYSTNFPLGSDRIKLPKHIKDRKSIISLDRDPVTKTAYKDNFCLFRCLCLHLNGLTEKRKVDQLYET